MLRQTFHLSVSSIVKVLVSAVCVPFVISLYFSSNLFQSLIAPIVFRMLYPSADAREIPRIPFQIQIIELFPLYFLAAIFALFLCWLFDQKSIGWEQPFSKERKIRIFLWICALAANIALSPVAVSVSMSDGVEMLLRDSFYNFVEMTIYLNSFYGLHFYVFTFLAYQLIKTLIVKQNRVPIIKNTD